MSLGLFGPDSFGLPSGLAIWVVLLAVLCERLRGFACFFFSAHGLKVALTYDLKILGLLGGCASSQIGQGLRPLRPVSRRQRM